MNCVRCKKEGDLGRYITRVEGKKIYMADLCDDCFEVFMRWKK